MMLKWDKSLLWEFILFYLFTWHQGSLGEGKVHAMLSPMNDKTVLYLLPSFLSDLPKIILSGPA